MEYQKDKKICLINKTKKVVIVKKLTYLPFRDAYFKSQDIVLPTVLEEFIDISGSLGRVIAKEIKCVRNMPPFNNSAMDGFAIRYKDIGKKVKINSTIFAGEIKKPSLNNCECYKIMTGAMVPDDADTIVEFEICSDIDSSFVTLPEYISQGRSLRIKGEERKIDEVLIERGTIITPNHIALLASQGITNIKVYKKISIAIVSTGNELKEPWQNASEYEIYNSNTYAILACLKSYNLDGQYMGVVPDNLNDITNFLDSLKIFDVVITTGGISMGEADFIAQAYQKNGLEVAFHGVKVKPGKPTMIGKMNNTYVMAMPGNPLTALVNFHILSIPMILKLQGANEYNHDFVYAKNKTTFTIQGSKSNIILGDLSSGEFSATLNNKYGSGMITPLAKSNSFTIFLEGKNSVKKDEVIKVIKFNDNMSKKIIDIFNL